jgi:hypothetical protein
MANQSAYHDAQRATINNGKIAQEYVRVFEQQLATNSRFF